MSDKSAAPLPLPESVGAPEDIVPYSIDPQLHLSIPKCGPQRGRRGNLRVALSHLQQIMTVFAFFLSLHFS